MKDLQINCECGKTIDVLFNYSGGAFNVHCPKCGLNHKSDGNKNLKFKNCKACTIVDGCKQIGICKHELVNSTNVFVENSDKTAKKTIFERSKIKFSVCEFEGKIYFFSEGNEYELTDLFTGATIIDKNFERIFFNQWAGGCRQI